MPIFNQNKAGIARAKAEMEQAAREYEAVRQSIVLQVRQAYTQYLLASQELELWDKHIVPSLEEAIERTEKSFAAGEVSHLPVLEAEGKLIEARIQQTQWIAQLNRTAAELNYSVGKKVI